MAPTEGNISLVMAAALPLLFWVWALFGWRRLAHGRAGRIYRSRNAAATIALVPLPSAAAVAWVSAHAGSAAALTGWIGSATVGTIAALGVAVHLAVAPEGSWLMRRFARLAFGRLAIVLTLGAAGAALARVLPRPELTVILAAVVIFHRHLRSGAAHLVQAHADVEGLTERMIALETAQRNAELVNAARAPVDKLDAAG